MATQGNQIRQTFVAATELPQYTFVVNTGVTPDGDNRQVGAPSAGGKVDGVVINQVLREDTAATVVVFGRTKVIAGGTIAAGAEIQTNAQGRAVTATTGVKVGRALEAAVAGQVISVDFYQGGAAAAA